jgi:hypothetical protein
MHVLSSPNLPDVDTQLDNISLSYIYNIIQELVDNVSRQIFNKQKEIKHLKSVHFNESKETNN